VKSASAKQSSVTLTQAIALHRDDPDVVALQLANTILSGEGTGSLLFRSVREQKGYVYSIDSSFDVSRSGATFSIDFASDPKNVDHAQNAALAQIERMRREVLPVETLEQAKALLIARDIVALDTYGGVAADLREDIEPLRGTRMRRFARPGTDERRDPPRGVVAAKPGGLGARVAGRAAQRAPWRRLRFATDAPPWP